MKAKLKSTGEDVLLINSFGADFVKSVNCLVIKENGDLQTVPYTDLNLKGEYEREYESSTTGNYGAVV